MINIAGVEDAYLFGKSTFESFFGELMQAFYAPADEAQFLEMWNGMPPVVHENLRKMVPREYAVVQKMIRGR